LCALFDIRVKQLFHFHRERNSGKCDNDDATRDNNYIESHNNNKTADNDHSTTDDYDICW